LRGNKPLDEYNLKDHTFLILDFEDGKHKRARNPNAVRKIKEEQKVKVDYLIKGSHEPLHGKVESLKYSKVKQLKKSILIDIGMDNLAELRLYSKSAPAK